MRTPLLPACFAVAAVAAVAANLKDPTEVARDWDVQATQNRAPILSPGLNPLGTRPPPPPALTGRDKPANPPPFSVTPWSRPRGPKGEPLLDAPGTQSPAILPDNVPPGAKEWRYNGQKYYVIPLNPGTRK